MSSTLKQRIRGLRNMNHQNHYFITSQDISTELSDTDILTALQCANIPPENLQEHVSRVRGGGIKTFAILLEIDQLHLVTKFVERDDFQKRESYEEKRFDDELPFEQSELERIFGIDDAEKIRGLKDQQKNGKSLSKKKLNLLKEAEGITKCAESFYFEQFHYCAPSFQKQSSHRLLRDKIVLPFLVEKRVTFKEDDSDSDLDNNDDDDDDDEGEEEEELEVGAGSFGTVYKVTLLGSFIESPEKTVQVARKELQSTSKDEYKNEVRVLGILRLLRHPSILELYCSYTHHDHHSLLFPLAKGDLGWLLTRSRNKRPAAFQRDEVFFVALSGLCSALKQVHDYTNLSLNIKMIGCHHDLKPNNVLIRDAKFVLSDFGISRIKDSDQGSKTIFKGGSKYYASPESQNLETLGSLTIGRSSDIWALGCMFMVVLVYLKHGREGVKKFEEDRRFEIPEWKWVVYTFHLPGKIHPEVGRWMDELRNSESCTPGELGLLDLVQEMLKLNHSERPKIDHVLLRLRLVTLRRLCEVVLAAFANVSRDYQNKLVLEIEKKTFEEWSWEVNLADPDSLDAKEIWDDSKFDILVNALQELRKELASLTRPHQDHTAYPIFLPAQRLVQLLLSSLPKDMQQRTRSRAETRILAGLNSTIDLKSELDEGSESHSRILKLFNIQYMKQQTQNLDDTSLLLNAEDLQPPEGNTFLTFTLRKANATSTKPERTVLVETLEYGQDIQSEQASQQVFSRMQNLLHLPSQNFRLRGLQCAGFYYERKEFGIVYDIPPLADGTSVTSVKTLAQILSQTQVYAVNLSDRFRLARDLAMALFEFHKIRWLHKSISSHNVIFVGDEASTKLSLPFITGFSHARPNEKCQFSNLIDGQDKELRQYLHPEYRRDDFRKYKPSYDYYSLGLVLLEIASWMPLKDIIEQLEEPGDDSYAVREKLKNAAGEMVLSTMGTKYSSAVEACLGDELKDDDIGLRFEECVVRLLASCSI
ncbi:hypothetical protein HD806DRAFT_514092 [Xylariaceae sp. AK1471]|nr:hypothetical protein HD806DRAFT_514092 [Xylariaceae sp. AK1471]